MNSILIQIKSPNNKQLIVFETTETKPSSGRTDTIYYQKSDNQVFYWDGSVYQTLTGITTTLFIDSYADLPTSGQSSDTLYITEDFNRIYEWTGTEYSYVKNVTSIVLQLVENVVIKYTHPAVPPKGININTIYTVVVQNGVCKISNNGIEQILDVNLVTAYFSPYDGRSWEDIYGNYIPPEPISYPSNTDKVIINSLKGIFDVNGNNYVDYAEDAGKLNGKTGAYYDNLINDKFSKSEDLSIIPDNSIVFGNKFKIKLNENLESLDIEVI